LVGEAASVSRIFTVRSADFTGEESFAAVDTWAMGRERARAMSATIAVDCFSTVDGHSTES
jgi:hypothetical protein